MIVFCTNKQHYKHIKNVNINTIQFRLCVEHVILQLNRINVAAEDMLNYAQDNHLIVIKVFIIIVIKIFNIILIKIFIIILIKIFTVI